jgi:hypothetical protein
LPLPPISSPRPVLIPARRSGLRLVTASPHVSASVEMSSDQVILDVAPLQENTEVAGVEATGLNGERSLEAERMPDGRHRLTVAAEGTWKVRARVDGRLRDVAWRGPEPVPVSDGPVDVELSPRGYIKVRRVG